MVALGAADERVNPPQLGYRYITVTRHQKHLGGRGPLIEDVAPAGRRAGDVRTENMLARRARSLRSKWISA